MQVYFVDDPLNPELKVVRYKEPRARRIEGGIAEASLSAPGRQEATGISHVMEDAIPEAVGIRDPILEADVVHVMAHEEQDDEAAYEEEDHFESDSDEDIPNVEAEVMTPAVVADVIDDN